MYKYVTICSSVTVAKRIAENIIKVLDNKEYLYDDSEMDSGIDVFNYHKNKIYEFKGNSELLKRKIYSNFDINKKNESKNLQPQKIIEKYITRVEENLNEIEKEDTNAIKLINELSEIKPGKEHAIIFQKYITRVLELIFKKYLSRPRSEFRINEGRKRPDIIFDNSAQNGFFHEINQMYNITCRQIAIECKNYTSTPSNPEIDQLLGRFNKYIGNFGILVCRVIENKPNLIHRCKDAMNNGQGMLLFFVTKI